MHEDHDRTTAVQARQERHAVLHLEDDVRPTEPTEEHEQRGPQVDGLVASPPDEVQPVAELAPLGAGALRGEQGDLIALVPQAVRHLLDIHLATPTFGVPGVAPVQDEESSRA